MQNLEWLIAMLPIHIKVRVSRKNARSVDKRIERTGIAKDHFVCPC